MKSIIVLVAVLLFAPALAFGQSQTVKEVTQEILDSNAYTRTHLKSPDNYSKLGALEFWSSGGLMNEIKDAGRVGQFDAFNVEVKHIHVIPLVEGQAAVAQYYSEGSMTPKGSPAVSHYLTRVTEVFVKEDGAWKIRAAHWSPVAGGGGTSQSALEQ